MDRCQVYDSIDKDRVEFLELVRAGLFSDGEARILAHGASVDWGEVYRLAEEQSVIGLVAAGIETLLASARPSQKAVLQFVSSTLLLEKRNKAMDMFVAQLVEEFRKADIYAILVKGQGVAQCYERPLWRACGDVDFLLDKDNYDKAKMFLTAKADSVDKEDKNRLHLAMSIKGWTVELHGTLFTGISNRLNKVVDEVQSSIFHDGSVRSWQNGKTQVFLPSADNDVFLVFSHILEHFYVEGIGLRQICDWCRLLWTYRDGLDLRLLESRLRKAGIMAEWKGFAALAVNTLGMPVEAMPLYDSQFKAKGEKVLYYVMKSGNFGHNKDNSYRARTSKMGGLFITFWRRVKDFAELTRIFHTQTLKIFLTYVLGRAKANMW